jgi:hypothetical protein
VYSEAPLCSDNCNHGYTVQELASFLGVHIGFIFLPVYHVTRRRQRAVQGQAWMWGHCLRQG